MAVACLLPGLSQGREVIETQKFTIGNRVFVQKRIVVSRRPVYETRIICTQVGWVTSNEVKRK